MVCLILLGVQGDRVAQGRVALFSMPPAVQYASWQGCRMSFERGLVACLTMVACCVDAMTQWVCDVGCCAALWGLWEPIHQSGVSVAALPVVYSGRSPSIAYPGLSKIHQPRCCPRSPAVIYVVLEDTNQLQETQRDACVLHVWYRECGRCAKDTEACSLFWLWRRGIWQVYGCVLSVGVFQWDTSVAAPPAGLMHRVTSTGC